MFRYVQVVHVIVLGKIAHKVARGRKGKAHVVPHRTCPQVVLIKDRAKAVCRLALHLANEGELMHPDNKISLQQE